MNDGMSRLNNIKYILQMQFKEYSFQLLLISCAPGLWPGAQLYISLCHWFTDLLSEWFTDLQGTPSNVKFGMEHLWV